MNKSEFLELNLPSRDNTTDIADINAISDNFKTIDDAFLDIVEKELPKYQTKDSLVDVIADNSSDDKLYPSVPAVSKYTNEKVEPLKIVNSASGNAIALKDSAKDKLVNLKLYGATTQDGTPTPTEPKELKSVGDSGSFEVGVFGNNLYSGGNLSFTKSTVITLDCPIVAGTYTLSCVVTSTDTQNKGVLVSFAEGGANGANVNIGIEKDKRATTTFTLINPVKHIRFNASTGFDVSTGFDATYTDIMLNIGDIALPYEEYKGQTLTNNDTLR
jgi:hypothetical protein